MSRVTLFAGSGVMVFGAECAAWFVRSSIEKQSVTLHHDYESDPSIRKIVNEFISCKRGRLIETFPMKEAQVHETVNTCVGC